VTPSSNVALDEAPGGCGLDAAPKFLDEAPKVLAAAAALPEELELDGAPRVLKGS
jgi:hypothetical protein